MCTLYGMATCSGRRKTIRRLHCFLTEASREIAGFVYLYAVTLPVFHVRCAVSAPIGRQICSVPLLRTSISYVQ